MRFLFRSEHKIAKGLLPQFGWMSFNITSAVMEWVIFPEKNFGLRIAVTKVEDSKNLIQYFDSILFTIIFQNVNYI